MANQDFIQIGYIQNNEFQEGQLRARDVFARSGASVDEHIMDESGNPHGTTRQMLDAAAENHTHAPAQVGLGNVNNTSDMDKPISTATNTALNVINGVLSGLGDAIDELEYVRSVVFDKANGDLTFTRRDGTVFNVNIPISELISGIDYDVTTGELVIAQNDGEEIRINVAALVPIYTGHTGTHIQIEITTSSQIQAILRAGSVGGDRLAPNVQLPGTPTVAQPPAQEVSGNQIATMGNVHGAVAARTIDAVFVESNAQLAGMNLREGALVFMVVNNE